MSKYLFDKAFMKKVLVLAIPLMMQNLVTVAVNLVDNLMVGMLGDAAIASVAAVNRYYMIASFAVGGLSMAGSVFLAQFHGAKQEEKMKQSFRTMLLLDGGIMILFTILALAAPYSILGFFTKDPLVIQDGVAYILIAAFSFFPAAITMSSYNAMRSIGETRIPLVCSMIAMSVNAVLNYVLMFGKLGAPAMGVAGAALATLIARVLEVVLSLWYLKKGDFSFKSSVRDLFRIEGDLLKAIVSKAGPLMLNEILWSLGMAVLFKYYSTRGPEVMSGYSICGTVADLFFTLFAGMSAATTVLVSTPLGADRLDEARENGYRLIGFSMFLAILLGILMYASTLLIPILYSKVSIEAQTVAIRYLHVQSLMFGIYMATAECYFILRSGGDMKHTLMMDSGFMWLLNIPLLAYITYCTDVDYIAMYLIGQCCDFVKLAASLRWVRKEHWVVNLTQN